MQEFIFRNTSARRAAIHESEYQSKLAIAYVYAQDYAKMHKNPTPTERPLGFLRSTFFLTSNHQTLDLNGEKINIRMGIEDKNVPSILLTCTNLTDPPSRYLREDYILAPNGTITFIENGKKKSMLEREIPARVQLVIELVQAITGRTIPDFK